MGSGWGDGQGLPHGVGLGGGAVQQPQGSAHRIQPSLWMAALSSVSEARGSFIHSLILSFFPFCKHSKFVPTSASWTAILKVWFWDQQYQHGWGLLRQAHVGADLRPT